MNYLLCPWDSPTFLIVSTNIPDLLYYSHFLAILAALLFAGLIYKHRKELQLVSIFLWIIFFFSLWTIIDVLLWATNRPDIVLFYWGTQVVLEVLTYIATFCFVFTFVYKKEISYKLKLLFSVLIAPVLYTLANGSLIPGVDISTCNAVESNFLFYYVYGFEILIIGWILVIVILSLFSSNKQDKKENILFGLGTIVYLMSFSSGNIIGSITENWNLAQIGLFGMPVFIGFLGYITIRYRTFNAKLIGAQGLVVTMALFTGARFFYSTTLLGFILTAVTFLVILVAGFYLIRSVKNEVLLREKTEELANYLKQANDGQANLIHIINHQIKGYLAKGRNIFSELNSGDYGTVTPLTKNMLDQGFASLTEAVDFVQGVLNSSSVESGTMKYNMAPFNLSEVAKEVVKNQQEPAANKKLTLTNEIEEGIEITGDKIELKEAFRNLINNSIIYTQSGSIHVSLKKINNKAVFTVQDTGIGLSPEDKTKLFTKGGRGVDSLKINVNSTGYGLSFVKGVTEAHEGKVWASSEGKGKGSTFTLELPLTLSKIALAKSTPTAQKTPRIGA